MTGRRIRGPAAWIVRLLGEPVTHKQAWLGVTAAILPVFGLLYGLATTGTMLLGLPHLSLITVLVCSIFGSVAAGLGSSYKIHRRSREHARANGAV